MRWRYGPLRGLLRIFVAEIKQVVVVRNPSGLTSGDVATWTSLGALSTFTHGFFLILTLPIWIVTGAATGLGSTIQPRAVVLGSDIQDLWEFARYPQGAPEEYAASAEVFPSRPAAPTRVPSPR